MFNFIANTIFNFLQYIIDLFPSSTGFPSSFHTAVISLGGYLHILDPLVPINIMLTCLTLIFSVEVGIFGFKTLRWLISHIPFIGGRGN